MSGLRQAARFFRERLPHLYLALRTLRYAGGREKLDPVSAAVLAGLSGGDEPRVLSGPFQGMRLLRFASGSGLLPKVVGSYEMEIHPAVEASLRRGYRRIVNVGCGEGYYAAGYARALPGAVVHAFDLDILARRRLRSLARRNGVADRIRSAARCRPEDLAALAGEGSLVFCDCEGCEKELLDPARAPALAGSDLLVELHDFLDPSISSALETRFRATHDIEIISMRERDVSNIATMPQLARLTPEQKRLAVWEGRPAGMQWAWMRSRAW
jgi:hypothetical protein